MFNPYQAQIEELQKKRAEAEALLQDPDFSELAQSEMEQITIQLNELEKIALDYSSSLEGSPEEEAEKVNCTFEIRPGAGGDEAKIWANDLKRMYVRFLEQASLKIEFIDDLVFKVKGRTKIVTNPHQTQEAFTAYELFKYESGVHRVQRVPETEAQGRIHTSTASVAVLPEVPVHAVVIREEDLEWQFMRASGAGGQSVNKTSSAVRLIHTPTGITTTCSQEKKQEQNRKIALDLLRSQLWEIEEEKRQELLGNARSVIGRAKRAEKIRTYNYPQNRITDHRTKQSWHNLPIILDGYMGSMLEELHQAFAKDTTSQTDETVDASPED